MKKVLLILLMAFVFIGCDAVRLLQRGVVIGPTQAPQPETIIVKIPQEEVDEDLSLGDCLIANCGGDSDDGDEREEESARETFKYLRDRYEADGEIDDDDFRDDALTDFRLGHPLNYPVGDGEVYVDLHREAGKNYYGGTVVVAYEKKIDRRTSKVATHRFHSGYGSDARYNVWSYFGGSTPKFHGFFENGNQAMILVVDELSQPLKNVDGKVVKTTAGSGSIWFRSFKGHDDRGNHNNCYEGGRYVNKNTWPEAPNKKCWFISIGPFNCQAWTSNHRVDTLRAVEPSSGSCYKKLADFEHLNVTKAFSVEDETDENLFITQ